MPIPTFGVTRRLLTPRGACLRVVRGEDGYTMFELLTVMVILGVVLIGLTTSFAAGLSAESGTIRRVQAQENARLALNRMRIDIHCASAAPAPQENPFGGFTLTLTETPSTCPSVTTTSSGVQWCTIPDPNVASGWQLFRFLGTVVSDCNGSSSATLLVDYVIRPTGGWSANTGVTPTPADWDGNLWPTPPTCAVGSLPAVSVQLAVNPEPVSHATEDYELTDTIALRNATRCT
jgi:prepilin-type N-terminal cleavage/methylation domain-containing protein